MVSKQWTKSDIKKVEEQLLALGSGRSEEVMQRVSYSHCRSAVAVRLASTHPILCSVFAALTLAQTAAASIMIITAGSD